MRKSKAVLRKQDLIRKKYVTTVKDKLGYRSETKKSRNYNHVSYQANDTGEIYFGLDYSPAMRGLQLMETRIAKLKQTAFERMIRPHFRSLVNLTPVHRGTARLNWNMMIGEQMLNASGVTSGRGELFRKEIDPGVTAPLSKAGGRDIDQAGKSSNTFLSFKKKSMTHQGKTYKAVLPQENYGQATAATKALVGMRGEGFDNGGMVEQFFKREFGPINMDDAGKRKAKHKLTEVRLSNNTPYLRFLEGSGKFGAPYTGGSKMYAEKEHRSLTSARNSLRKSNTDDEFDPSGPIDYKAKFVRGDAGNGWIYQNMNSLNNVFKHFMDVNQPHLRKSTKRQQLVDKSSWRGFTRGGQRRTSNGNLREAFRGKVSEWGFNTATKQKATTRKSQSSKKLTEIQRDMTEGAKKLKEAMEIGVIRDAGAVDRLAVDLMNESQINAMAGSVSGGGLISGIRRKKRD
jgi:hypothetical protein